MNVYILKQSNLKLMQRSFNKKKLYCFIGSLKNQFESRTKYYQKNASIRLFSSHKTSINWWNHPEICTIPNIITVSRIIASPALAYAVIYDLKTVALGGCVIFAFSDWLDGFLARKLNQQTILGAFLDPVADKFMIGSLSIGLVYQGLLPYQLAALFVGRDFLILSCGLIIRAIEKPKDAFFFDTLSSATFNITPSDMSKINTALQFSLLGLTLSNFTLGYPVISTIEPLWWISASTTILSGIGYLGGAGISHIKNPKINNIKKT